jgi:hypothetical protein
MKNSTAWLLAITMLLSACGTVGSANLSNEGPGYIGKPAQTLFSDKGAPLRQLTSPSGATVYVYEAHNLYGSTFCEASYYVRALPSSLGFKLGDSLQPAAGQQETSNSVCRGQGAGRLDHAGGRSNAYLFSYQ